MRPAHRGWRTVAAAYSVLALVATLFIATSPASAGGARHEWIVVLKGEPSARAASVASQHAARYGARVQFTYSHAINGYAASVPDARIGQLRNDPDVASIERVATVTTQDTQYNPPWGLDRIDQFYGLSSSYSYFRTGLGVNAYIVDSGLNFGHAEFDYRALNGYDAVDGGWADDCHGHGTHVAGTVGGRTYGVAKYVRLVAVRVTNCYGVGTTSQTVAGLDWVVADHGAGQPAVANLSVSGPSSSAVDSAVGRVIADGVTVVAAAGNNSGDACNYSPGRVAAALTIASSDQYDVYAWDTNHGSCVDWFSPGVGIRSAWIGSSTANALVSGTSQAAPHTAGVAALYLQGDPGASPATVASALRSITTKDAVYDPSTANNDMLFTYY